MMNFLKNVYSDKRFFENFLHYDIVRQQRTKFFAVSHSFYVINIVSGLIMIVVHLIIVNSLITMGIG